MQLIREIRERRVMQALGVYVGACWLLIEILDRLVERYLLSPTLTDLVFWGLFSLLPAVILIAYEHGKPGKDQITRVELVGIPINLIATTGLLMSVFSGQHMGSTADKVMITDEQGQQIETYIPKSGFRHSMMLFFWENQSNDNSLDWLQYGLTDMLTQDLSQNPFLMTSSPYTDLQWGFYSTLVRAGYNDALRVPLSLQREIAQKQNQDFFINGDLHLRNGDFVLSARLYRPSEGQPIATFSFTDAALMPLVDRLSVAVKEKLEVPSGGGRLAEDLSVAEQFSNNIDAVHKYIDARSQRLIQNDFVSAIADLDAALELDPSFALAGLAKIDMLTSLGRSAEAIAMARKIEPHEYKLSGRHKDSLKALIYTLLGEREKTNAVLQMRVKLNPDDTAAYWRLADHYNWSGQLDAALQTYEKILQMDPHSDTALLKLSNLYRSRGDIDKAIDYAMRYGEQRPDDISAAIRLGLLYQDNGERELARQQFERAALQDAGTVSPLIRLAELSARSGNTRAAEDYLFEARQVANNPQQHSLVLAARIRLLERQGRLRDALEMLQERRSYEEQYNRPLDIVFEVDMQSVNYLMMLDEFEQADALLTAAETELQPPLDEFMQIGHAFSNIKKGDKEAAQQSIARGAGVLQQFGLGHVEFQIDYARGLLAHIQHDYAECAKEYRSAINRIQTSIMGSDLSGMVVEFFGNAAECMILAGDLDAAVVALEHGFQMDDASGKLWTERARLQWIQDQPALAKASLSYALAIWSQADPDYVNYKDALRLAEEMHAVEAVPELTQAD